MELLEWKEKHLEPSIDIAIKERFEVLFKLTGADIERKSTLSPRGINKQIGKKIQALKKVAERSINNYGVSRKKMTNQLRIKQKFKKKGVKFTFNVLSHIDLTPEEYQNILEIQRFQNY